MCMKTIEKNSGFVPGHGMRHVHCVLGMGPESWGSESIRPYYSRPTTSGQLPIQRFQEYDAAILSVV